MCLQASKSLHVINLFQHAGEYDHIFWRMKLADKWQKRLVWNIYYLVC